MCLTCSLSKYNLHLLQVFYVVDLHNMSRQNDLALEKNWITLDGLFRIYTTTIGMLVTDMWKIFRVHNKSEDLFTSKSIIQFADALAYEMINWAGNFEEKENRNEMMNPTTVCVSVDGSNNVSTLTQDIRHDKIMCEAIEVCLVFPGSSQGTQDDNALFVVQ